MHIRNFSFIFLLILASLSGGCENVSYIRSDVFAQHEYVKNIYMMPVVPEITIDAGFKFTKEKFHETMSKSIELIKTSLRKEFTLRGYKLDVYPKNYPDLSVDNSQDKCAKEAVLEFLKPVPTTGISFHETQISKQEKVYSLKDFSPENYDPLVTKSLECKSFMPDYMDTVLYLNVRSHIARRGFLASLSESSTIGLKLRLISFKEKAIIFSFERNYERSDLLSEFKTSEAVEDILKNIPVRF